MTKPKRTRKVGGVTIVRRKIPSAPLQSAYPIRDLEVGESFFIPDVSKIQSMRTHASRLNKKLGRRYSVRKDHQDPEDPTTPIGAWVDRLE